ncbi:MAG TPA: glycosyltransferase family 4 protein [Anaerolineales bacterium]|nr:glycosyltransferase family 4 protein [Anaerolineales bacterium]
MRILICRSNPVAPDPRVEKEASALVEAGHMVTILAWDRTAKIAAQEEQNGISIHRLAIRSDFGKGLRNLPALLRWQWGLLKWLRRHRREYDAVHACDFDTVIPCLLAKFLWDKRLVYDIFDFYADHVHPIPAWIRLLIQILDFWIINRADAVILADDSRRNQISTTKPKRLYVIYNTPEDVITKYRLLSSSSSDTFRLAYVGLLQKERGLVEVLSVLKKHPEWTLDIAGFGGDEDVIHKICMNMPNVTWHGRVPYERALKLSACADVLFATYDPAIPNHRYSSPNKLFEAMMLGKPIIVSHGTNIDRIVLDHQCGIVIPYGDINKLEDAFLQLANDHLLRKKLGNNGRKAYETFYNWDIMKTRLIGLYSQISAEHA